jgi:hypothetical protein
MVVGVTDAPAAGAVTSRQASATGEMGTQARQHEASRISLQKGPFRARVVSRTTCHVPQPAGGGRVLRGCRGSDQLSCVVVSLGGSWMLMKEKFWVPVLLTGGSGLPSIVTLICGSHSCSV